MVWDLRHKEMESVLLLDGPMRYRYFIKKVADEERLWSLRQQDGWALECDDAGRVLVPVWPHEAYASLCSTGIWSGYHGEGIDLDSWLARWIPGMQADSHLVAIFPVPNNRGIVVEPRRLEADLREELLKYR